MSQAPNGLEKALFQAVRAGNASVVADCLAKNPSLGRLREEGDEGATALMLAATDSTAAGTECVKALLAYSNVRYMGALGGHEKITALMLAAKDGCVDNVRLLMDESDLNAEGTRWMTALMHAAKEGQVECLNVLLDKADARHRSEDGWTALMHAASMGHWEATQVLAKASDVLELDHYGQTAVHFAADKGHAAGFRLLWTLAKQRPNDLDPDWNEQLLMKAVGVSRRKVRPRTEKEETQERPEIVESLLQVADPHFATPEGTTALMIACSRGQLPVIERLLPHGGLERTDKIGRTPLIMAAAYGHDHCLPALIPGSDVGHRDGDGRSALMHASFHGHEACVQALLGVMPPGEDTRRALDLAMEREETGCADLLASHDSIEVARHWLRQLPVGVDLPRTRAKVEHADLEGLLLAPTASASSSADTLSPDGVRPDGVAGTESKMKRRNRL